MMFVLKQDLKPSVYIIYNALVVLLLVSYSCEALRRSRNLYQKITSDTDLTSFEALLKTNRIARIDLTYEAVTAFVPEDSAFDSFSGIYDQELTYYHLSYEVKTLQQLALSRKVMSVRTTYPPLWISLHNNDLYVNNAKVIRDRSDFLGKTRDADNGKIQMLHILDEVLDPIIRNTSIDPTAFQLLSTPYHWRITENLELFYEKVIDAGLQSLFQEEGGHTFFIPVDKNIDDHRYNLLDNYTIQSHVIPNQVLFTRPANKHFFYETSCNGDYIYVLVSFVEKDGKTYAKSTTVLEDSDHPKGEVLAEIVEKNIPVKNGVVHLISKPLVIFDRELKPFPFLTVYYKISSDPFLQYSYDIGQNTEWNSVLEDVPSDKKITYFVPRNQAWKKAFQDRIYMLEEQKAILGRHIILDSTAYTMDRLLHLSKTSYNGSVKLSTVSGEDIMLNIIYSGGSYFINFNDTFIRVYRENYLCEDGVIHVLDDTPLLYQHERLIVYAIYPPLKANTEGVGTSDTSSSTGSWFWHYVQNAFS